MDIKYSERENVAIITLDRPKYLNTLTLEMIDKIEIYLKAILKNENIHMVIFKGEGEKAFCAGGDVKSFYNEKIKEKNQLRSSFFYREYKLNYFIKKYKKPIISFVNGICMGGGVGIAMHSKITIVSENVTFAMPETAIGLFPDVGAGKILSKLDHNIGFFLGLTGKRLKSSDLIEVKLANYCIAKENFNEVENSLSKIKTLKSINNVLKKYSIKTKSALFPYLNKKITNSFKYKKIEEIILALKNNNENWAKEALDSIYKMSPTSLKITLKQINLAKNVSFKDDLIMEYRLSQACMAGVDFYEGVRAVLVDRDFKPNWKPSKIEEVDNKLVLSHFKSLGKNDLKI
jgi:enoyl-CoA hydratase/carnithine racemase